jgi:asparagine synthetase B (glutamine-hydrolysing)
MRAPGWFHGEGADEIFGGYRPEAPVHDDSGTAQRDGLAVVAGTS